MTYEGVARPWAPGVGLALYRIVQEALTNTLKHAGPRASAQVRLRCTPTGVDLEPEVLLYGQEWKDVL